ncbi:2-dehydro-3-deoxygalactonokinase [Roseovarius mucosus]|uniref:2-dehydro-3-deoxygalactonokinase n=1 Tax=Roseovarius mucosus TaxID=215743 RepID=UPI0035D0C6C8|tara:strand:- start:33 stop:752 length:720 start_codon:yes stop_codon:yes gene_type:complete
MTDWAAIGHDGACARAFVMQGARIVEQAAAPDEAAARAQLLSMPQRVFRIGEGQGDHLPTQVLPQGGRGLAPLVQDTPPDVIDAWVRLLLIGVLQARAQWDGVAWVVGRDLSHWVHLSAREAVSCQSFVTPRLVRLLGGAVLPCAEAMADTLSRPERLAAHLRGAEVRGGSAAITGHLLAAELAAARPYWLGQSVVLIADGSQAAGLAGALREHGAPVEHVAPESLIASALAALAGVLA